MFEGEAASRKKAGGDRKSVTANLRSPINGRTAAADAAALLNVSRASVEHASRVLLLRSRGRLVRPHPHVVEGFPPVASRFPREQGERETDPRVVVHLLDQAQRDREALALARGPGAPRVVTNDAGDVVRVVRAQVPGDPCRVPQALIDADRATRRSTAARAFAGHPAIVPTVKRAAVRQHEIAPTKEIPS